METMVKVLTVADRCDRCGAQAYQLAQKDGAEIYFCNHHGNRHAPLMEEQGWFIIKENIT